MKALDIIPKVLALSALACLPDDTRPPPGKLTVDLTVSEPSPELETDDGWRVSFDEVLLGIGEVELGGDDCNAYNESDYLRLLDLRRAGPQRLNIAYALGVCELDFGAASPSRDTVLGTGVDERAAEAMQVEGSDAFVEDAGTVLYVRGHATRGERELLFAWSFRRELEYPACVSVTLSGEEERTLSLGALPSALFRAGPSSEELVFEPYAAADVDGDHDVTLAELELVPLEPTPTDPFDTLAERLYLGLAPAVVRGPDGARCSSQIAEEEDF